MRRGKARIFNWLEAARVTSDHIPRKRFEKLCFLSAETPEARNACERLKARYGHSEAAEADVIIALGGDGFMLHTLHQTMNAHTPIYGMHRGTVGFLMNEYGEDDLILRLESAEITVIHPLRMEAVDVLGETHFSRAINEVALLRQTHQAAKLSIAVDGKTRLEELVCDGVLVATPAGSTAYNLSAHGPILPINAPLLALTPISAFRPRRWRGALLPNTARVTITVLGEGKRSVSATADNQEFRNVKTVHIAEDTAVSMTLLFDPGHSLDERILQEQFLP